MWWLLLLVPLCFGAPRITPKCEDDMKNVGNTAGYNVASELLTKAINFSADPCKDFFEFTCGNWIANHPIPNHKTSYSQFGNLSDKVQEKMREIFESKEMFGSKSMNALKAMYSRCMDKNELNRVGARRLLESIRGYGVWPMLDGDDKWRVEDFDLTSLLIHVSEVRGVDVFVSNYVSLDNRNVSRRLIEVCKRIRSKHVHVVKLDQNTKRILTTNIERTSVYSGKRNLGFKDMPAQYLGIRRQCDERKGRAWLVNTWVEGWQNSNAMHKMMNLHHNVFKLK
ncbi:hypothetical protein Y032_0003g1329 [Ancylostoma ceylanicum]|uniref:Peptidase M13 N-terminal domain-containing protein n=1 Tax=Ancylostoma ceylanicum TaxID=53326 RepID=A0A016VY60_9BILA|nr:hypothetical protein Y032_0003g1329 [Ancylostoma ceylanicum]